MTCFTTHWSPSSNPVPSFAEHAWICHGLSLMLKSDSDEAYRNVSVVLVLLCWLVHSVYLLQRKYFEPHSKESFQNLNDAESGNETI